MGVWAVVVAIKVANRREIVGRTPPVRQAVDTAGAWPDPRI